MCETGSQREGINCRSRTRASVTSPETLAVSRLTRSRGPGGWPLPTLHCTFLQETASTASRPSACLSTLGSMVVLPLLLEKRENSLACKCTQTLDSRVSPSPLVVSLQSLPSLCRTRRAKNRPEKASVCVCVCVCVCVHGDPLAVSDSAGLRKKREREREREMGRGARMGCSKWHGEQLNWLCVQFWRQRTLHALRTDAQSNCSLHTTTCHACQLFKQADRNLPFSEH